MNDAFTCHDMFYSVKVEFGQEWKSTFYEGFVYENEKYCYVLKVYAKYQWNLFSIKCCFVWALQVKRADAVFIRTGIPAGLDCSVLLSLV